MKNLKIATSEIREAKKLARFIENYQCAGIDDLVKQQNLAVSCTFELMGKEILLTGKIQGTITLECGRCLEPYRQPVSIAVCQSFPADIAEIDLGHELCESLILELPQKPLCRAECAGLCSQCGKNRNRETCSCAPENIDPRWGKLQEFMEPAAVKRKRQTHVTKKKT